MYFRKINNINKVLYISLPIDLIKHLDLKEGDDVKLIPALKNKSKKIIIEINGENNDN